MAKEKFVQYWYFLDQKSTSNHLYLSLLMNIEILTIPWRQYEMKILFRLCLKNFDGITIEFIIGGDGPKRIVIEETIERYGLQSQVQVCPIGYCPFPEWLRSLLLSTF